MKLDTLDNVFAAFDQQKVMIIGDVMIDSYLWGEVNRISPEAPVPVVNVKKRETRLGGAANVAVNVKALGATPILCSVIGEDSDGGDFLELLDQSGLSKEGIVQSEDRLTTIKHRILSGHQHMLRVDSEVSHHINEKEIARLWERIADILPACSVVIFEDYDKGILQESLIQKVIQRANELGIPTVVDPKKRNFLSYREATLFKPNLKELREGLKVDLDEVNQESLLEAVEVLKNTLQIEQALVTLSEKGVFIYQKDQSHLIPAHIRSIADVSGAGDTVVSVAALCTALKLAPKFTASLSNLAGGLVCEYLGVVSINKKDLLEEAREKQIFEYI